MKQFGVVGLTIGFGFVLAGAQALAENEKKTLQGLWQAVAGEESGEQARPRLLETTSWEFKGDEFIWRAEGQVEMKGSYTIDPRRTPKEIDLVATDRKIKCVGIYDLQGDTLRIRFHEDKDSRPKAFTTDRASRDHFLLVLRRSK